jgi:pimeloyl-ACP methyl ester carboxylesterase
MLDLERLGVAGHSIGGAAVFDLAIGNPQVRAGAVLDGLLDHRLARTRAQAGARVRAPFLLFRSRATSAGEIRANLERGYGVRAAEAFPDGAAGLHRMASEQHEAQCLMLAMMAGPRWFLKLQGARHNAFTDLPLLSADPAPFQGDADVAFTRATIGELVSAFFAEQLLKQAGAFGDRLNGLPRGVCTVAAGGTADRCGPPPPPLQTPEG